MDANRFDAWTRALSGRLSRRGALRGGGAALAATTLGPAGLAAQDATPAVLDGTPAAGGRTEFLFVQVFAAGTWAPKPGEEGVYELTLTGVTPQTVYFSDRPARLVGVLPMERFVDRLGFTPADPPNAALVTRTDAGEDVLVVELLNPVYDAATGTLTYDARLLEGYQEAGLAALAARQQDAQFPDRFGAGGLFIDSADSCGQCCDPCLSNDDCCGGFDCVGGGILNKVCYQDGCPDYC